MVKVRPARSVLLVDDDVDGLQALASLIEHHFPTVKIHTETDPRRALDQLGRETPSVVIVDYRMPQMDGVEFLRHAKEIAPEAKRVLATAYPEEWMMSADVDLVLVKPLNTAPFMRRLEELFGPSRSTESTN